MAAISRGNPNIGDLGERILAGRRLDPSTTLSLDELATLHHELCQAAGVDQRVDVVLQDDRALVQFTGVPPGSSRVYIASHRRLTTQDFSRTIANPVFHGDVLTTTVRQRFREERINLLVAGGSGLLFSVLLFLLGNSAAASYGDYLANPQGFPSVERVVNVIVHINEMLLTSATLFLSIFLVFTVAQSSKLQEDTRLFDAGLLHKFERDDRLVAVVALAGLILSVINVVILGLPTPWYIASRQVGGYTITLNKVSLVSSLMTGLTIAALVFCFLALLYYLKRTMLITNRNMSEKVLSEAQTHAHSGQRSSVEQGGTNGNH